MNSTAIETIVAVLRRVSKKSKRVVLTEPFIIRHGITAREIYVDGKSHEPCFVCRENDRIYPLTEQSDFVQQRVADMLSQADIKELRRELNFWRQQEWVNCE